jgi:SAM-dependent methyltransferase
LPDLGDIGGPGDLALPRQMTVLPDSQLALITSELAMLGPQDQLITPTTIGGLNQLKAELPRDRPIRVVDAGCGPGLSSKTLAVAFADREIVLIGLDRKPGDRERAALLLPDGTFLEAELNDQWPPEARDADVVQLRAVVGHQPHPQVTLQRAYEALAAGGFMQVQTWQDIIVQVNPDWPEPKQTLARAIAGRRDALVNAYKYSDPPVNILYGSELTGALDSLPDDRVRLRNDVERITGPLDLFMQTMGAGRKNTDLEERLELIRGRVPNEQVDAWLRAVADFREAAPLAEQFAGSPNDIVAWDHRIAIVGKPRR